MALIASTSWADKYGVDEAMAEGSGSAAWWGMLFAAAFFYGLYRFMASSQNEQRGFLVLMAGVFVLLVVAGLAKCAT